MTFSTEFASLKLLNAQGFGAKSFHIIFEKMLQNSISVENLFELSANDFSHYFPELGSGRFKSATYQSLQNVENNNIAFQQQDYLQQNGLSILNSLSEEYPKRLLERMGTNAPAFLFTKGKKNLLHGESFSIVGARSANDASLNLTYEIAKKLSLEGYNITSGFAKGVDTQAHLGALENFGTTTLVLSFGMKELLKQSFSETINWKTNSLAVSQFSLEERWRGTNAMTRNKLVCALSKALIVIETGEERDSTGKMSGTFDAGKTALSMGIPVFVLSPNCKCFELKKPSGNESLIRLGGIEVTSLKQILNYFSSASDTLNIPNNIFEKQVKLFA